MAYYAHVSEDGLRRQTVAEHLKGTAALCRTFAAAFGAEADGELVGATHDLGKCTEDFQKRLLENGKRLITPRQEPWHAPHGISFMLRLVWQGIMAPYGIWEI